MSTREYYQMIRNHVQLKGAKLVSLKCENHGLTEENKEKKVGLRVKRSVEVRDTKSAELYLEVTVTFEDEGPFSFEVVYKGYCQTESNLDEEVFEEYCYHQVVPLLLPYVRECISSTMARMHLPIFNIPTMDVLNSVQVNIDSEE